MPAPNVDSCVIRLDVRNEPHENVNDEAFLFKVIRAAFSQRRKTLPNPLSGVVGLPKDKIAQCLESCGLKATARAEELTLEQFIKLANALKEARNG